MAGRGPAAGLDEEADRQRAGSVADPVPPGTARQGRCAVCLHCAAGTRGQVSWCPSRAAARGCVKTPESRIAFPLEARIARLQSTLAPLPCQSAQALRDWSPPARLFTQSGEVLGIANPTSTTHVPGLANHIQPSLDAVARSYGSSALPSTKSIPARAQSTASNTLSSAVRLAESKSVGSSWRICAHRLRRRSIPLLLLYPSDSRDRALRVAAGYTSMADNGGSSVCDHARGIERPSCWLSSATRESAATAVLAIRSAPTSNGRLRTIRSTYRSVSRRQSISGGYPTGEPAE